MAAASFLPSREQMNAKGNSNVTLLRRAYRSILPPREREILTSLVRKILGRHWKTFYFGDIDRMTLESVSGGPAFDAGLKIAPLFLSRPGAVFDIGANAGRYTYVLERAAGAGSTYAFEPISQLSSRLMRIFPEVHVLNMALSDAEGSLDLRIPIVDGVPFWGRSTLERFHFTEPGETGTMVQQVSVKTLDALCEEMKIQDVRFIKIDVEGHEHNVLRGATNTLAAWHPVLLVEIEQRHHLEPVGELFAWIRKQGYSGFFYDAHRALIRPIEQFAVDSNQRLDDHGSTNYINNFYFVESDTAREMVDNVNRRIPRRG